MFTTRLGALAHFLTFVALMIASTTASPRAQDVIAARAAGACAPLSTFTNDIAPPACWTPYAPSSVWNQKLGANPRYASNSNAIVTYYFSNYGGHFGPDSITDPYDGSKDYGFPYYFSRASDPLVTIRCHGYGGNACGKTVHVPANALSERGSCCSGDQHMAIVDLTNNSEFDLYQWTTDPPYQNGQSVSVNAGNTGNIVTGDGFWPCAGATAGCNGLLGGVVFISQLERGEINHKLAVAFPCTAYNDAVYPEHGGSYQSCKAPGGTKDTTAPIGSLVYWDETPARIDGRPISRDAKLVLKTLHAYGGIVTDTNGNNGSLSISNTPESPTRYVAMGKTNVVRDYASKNFKHRRSYLLQLRYQIDLDDIPAEDVEEHLHVLDPCVARKTC